MRRQRCFFYFAEGFVSMLIGAGAAALSGKNELDRIRDRVFVGGADGSAAFCGRSSVAGGKFRGNVCAAANSVYHMKNETAVCTCGHAKSQHNPAGRCLVQATSQPTGRGQRQQKICGCLHFRALSTE